jgi:large subunit ribosomal protein L9
LDGKTITLKAKAGGQGKLFGSVTSKEVAAELNKVFGTAIDKKKMTMADIKNFGEYSAEVKLYTGISAKITVKVEE